MLPDYVEHQNDQPKLTALDSDTENLKKYILVPKINVQKIQGCWELCKAKTRRSVKYVQRVFSLIYIG